jgi:hypothetical protein
MSILMLIEEPGMSTETYDRTNAIVGIRGDADAPDGLISHVCAVTGDGLVIADVWESEAALTRFFEERLGAALAQVGMDAKPRIVPVHNLIAHGAGTAANVLLVWEADGFTPAAYDAITSKMPAHAGGGGDHPSVSHVAGTTETGMVFVDVWDSPESAGRFVEAQIAPAAGGELPVGEPRFMPVHFRIVGA